MDRCTDDQLLAVARLIGACEALAGSGHLREDAEMRLREQIASARSAFQLYPEGVAA